MDRYFFTSESVAEGHPDKLADQISDALLDAYLIQDSSSRVACETLVTRGMCLVAGEITSHSYVNIPDIVRHTIAEVGYTRAKYGFDAENVNILIAIQAQSPDIAIGVNTGGAGDQGMMFGFACAETPELMPLPITLAHKLVRQLAEVRKTGVFAYLRPDGKSQVTVEYDGHKPVRIDSVLIAAQHRPDIPQSHIFQDVVDRVVKPVLPAELVDDKTRYLVNPTGSFTIGGPGADTGLTGRKIIVDTYGGMARHGGGCFSGKDPTKVDRSAAYMMRYVAKNIVAAGIAERCELQVGYAIGEREPLSIHAETFETGKIPSSRIVEIITKVFDLTPRGIIRKLDLLRPIYRQTAVYGHFGRTDLNVSWEATDMVETLRREAGI